MSTDAGLSQFYTVEQVASILQVCRVTVYRLIHANKLAAYRIGAGCYRIPRAAFATFLNTCQTSPAKAGESS